MEALRQFVLAQQFNPGFAGLWVNPFFHARRGLFQAIKRLGSKIEGRTLDVGCGSKPYQALFAASEYVGLDLDTPDNRARKQADVFYDGNAFPFPLHSFDSVVCSQVLEHVFVPERFLGEIFRVLRPGGCVLLTVPFVWDEHEQPNDFGRYSSFGLRYLFEKAGFKILEQRKINADVRALFQLVTAYLYKVLWTRHSLLNLVVCVAFMAPFNILGALIYRLVPSNPDLFLDNVVLAIRPE